MTKQKSQYTRPISPKLGILGILGFVGVAGFLPKIYHITEILPTPTFFFFFAFFGFFGFYYEGKMSHTLMDERFQANAYRAMAIANKFALTLILAAAILSMSVLRLEAYDMLALLIAVLGLAFGLSIFLQQYLLYRFENEE